MSKRPSAKPDSTSQAPIPVEPGFFYALIAWLAPVYHFDRVFWFPPMGPSLLLWKRDGVGKGESKSLHRVSLPDGTSLEFQCAPSWPAAVLQLLERFVEQALAIPRDRGTQDFLLCLDRPSWARQVPVWHKYATAEAPLLIQGPVGSGKSSLARALHALSRPGHPLVEINLAAIPANLAEIELFGHAKGAFTDAAASKPGKLTLAAQGTVVLDGIEHLAGETQAALSSALERQAFFPLGSNQSIPLSCRIITLSSVPMAELLGKGTLRESLFYQLNVLPIHLPGLQETPEDLGFLIRHCLADQATDLDEAQLKRLAAHLASQGACDNLHKLKNTLSLWAIDGSLAERADGESSSPVPQQKDLKASVDLYKKQLIHDIVCQCGGNQTKAAHILGIQRTYLSRLIKELSITF